MQVFPEPSLRLAWESSSDPFPPPAPHPKKKFLPYTNQASAAWPRVEIMLYVVGVIRGSAVTSRPLREMMLGLGRRLIIAFEGNRL